MKTALKRVAALFFAMMLPICCFMSYGVSADNSQAQEGRMNLDVVFALDASGSMLKSDPERIALDAFSLFVDMCDDSCRVGYDVYTHMLKASENLTDVGENEDLDIIRKRFENITYEATGDTDIALGLTEAMRIFERSDDNDFRRKAIVLLSDGNTDLPKGPRTVAESAAEMSDTLQKLHERHIEVYSVGLNVDGSLDKKDLENISGKTDGKVYEIDGSEKLTNTISDIFANISDMNGVDRVIKDGKIELEVSDDSVLYANVVVRTKLTPEAMSPVLISPNGSPVSLSANEKVKVTHTKSYMLIKIYYPEPGTWTLMLENANGSNCNVKQMNYYAVFVEETVPERAAINTAVNVEAKIKDSNGIISDSDLLSTIKMTGTVSGNNGNITFELTRTGNGTYKGSFVPKEVGDYDVVVKAESDRFGKESIRSKLEVLTTLDEVDTVEQIFTFLRENIMAVLIGAAVLVVLVIIIVLVKK